MVVWPCSVLNSLIYCLVRPTLIIIQCLHLAHRRKEGSIRSGWLSDGQTDQTGSNRHHTLQTALNLSKAKREHCDMFTSGSAAGHCFHCKYCAILSTEMTVFSTTERYLSSSVTTVKIEMRYVFSNLFIICFTKHDFYILKLVVLVSHHSLTEGSFVTPKTWIYWHWKLAVFVININWPLKCNLCRCSFSQ